MTDLRVGFKQAILQRIQGIRADSNQLLTQSPFQNSVHTSAHTRQHTDFSINRILSDAKAVKDSNPIDLSKSNSAPTPTCSTGSGTLSASTSLAPTTGYYPQPGRSTTSENLVKPKVYKFWDLNALANCNGCDRYFKNFAFPNIASMGGALWSGFPQVFPHRSDFVERLVMQSVTVDVKSQQQKILDDEISYKCTICDKVFGCASTLEVRRNLLIFVCVLSTKM